MGLTMAQHRQAPSQFIKDEPGHDSHHPHHPQQGQAPHHLQQHPRPSSIVHQHHQAPPPPPPPQQQQHPGAYSAQHQVYQQQTQAAPSQHAQELPQYYAAHPSPYSTPGANSGYTSAETGDMMATTMPRPYPPMSYHTPQSNSPASVASPSAHDQRNMYAQPTSQLHQPPMYYGQQTQYSSMPNQAAASPYAQHAHAQQPHQPMNPQQNMMMQHAGAQHQMSQHQSQHQHHQQQQQQQQQQHHQQQQQQQHQQAMPSPRHTKIEAHPQIQRAPAPGPLGPSQGAQNGASLPAAAGAAAPGVNSNAAPGPIPATTPLVVRQDQNGVQWIAFEYSRDRVKMEYTIRCDVESVNTEELSPEFKTENCVYPRACCAKDQYRGNRLQYETECNTVGWALAQLNAPLRGKRGLIQRAVDSWRNSNQDPRLRSRRVRRMAKMNHRKAVSASPHPTHMAAPGGPSPIPPPGAMGHGGPGAMGKPGMNGMASQMHHHHHEGGQGGDEVDDGEYMDDQHHHHHQAPPGSDERPSQVFSGYGNYPSGAPASMPSAHDPMSASPHAGAVAVSRRASVGRNSRNDEPDDLFPDLPEAKKRKFILVEDSDRQSRLRVRVTLEGVDTREIPDSFRKGSSVFPRSYFPREMQSPPPSATGSRFFPDDTTDAEDDGAVDTEGRRAGRGGARGTALVKVSLADGKEGEVAIPRTRAATRGKEVRLNDLGYRMAWLQSRVFAGRTVFLQRALDCYRNKTRSAIEQLMLDVKTTAPHYETRPGKRRWGDRMRRGDKKEDD